MRVLAIARLRLLARVRTASVLFALATIPPLLISIVASWLPESDSRAQFPFFAPIVAVWSLLMWILHVAILLIGTEAAEELHPRREGADWSDLLDTVPLSAGGRFAGEAFGTMALNVTIHLCALPLLAMVAVLSPLPLSTFLVLEAMTLALFVLSGSAAAWKRLAAPSRWSGTRMARSGMLFWLLLGAILYRTSRWNAFVESLSTAFFQPSPRSWQRITSTIEHPAALALLLALLCTSYVAFYYFSSVRGLTRRREI